MTLITGPSGTGKELAARAIAQARYLSFDERTLRFEGEQQTIFFPINISALSPTLIESELFGHRRDRSRWRHRGSQRVAGHLSRERQRVP